MRSPVATTLQDVLSARTVTAAPELVDPPSHVEAQSATAAKQAVRCHACGHQCRIPDGAVGVCKVRFNKGGTLQVPWGYVGGVQCDPVEKKPFFHLYPGALAYSFGMLGCDLHCSYCQNWVTSQALRDPHAGAAPQDTTPHSLVQDALRQGAKLVVSTYNEPLITVEWAVAIFREARAQGLATAFVSNGNGTPRVLEYLRPHIDAYKVDLKSFDDRHYRELGGRLEPILDTIKWLHGAGVWVEIVTLLVPGFNDSEAELNGLTNFVASVSPDIPWHVTAFHQDYRMTDPANTTPAMLVRAADIARRAGLRYVYAGNVPGHVGDLEHTHCASCGERIISRYGYFIQEYRLLPDGSCPRCRTSVPGVWSARFEGQRTAFPFLPHDRTRLSVR
jgi:pyruvate formate lyase activating enzyme